MKKENMMMSSGLVSIVIPIYNAAEYLEKCLNSVFTQTYKNIEVICINDGSTDNSIDILYAFLQKYPEYILVKTIKNSGQANARNVGMELASGEFLCFVDSDDTIESTMIEKLYKNIIKYQTDLAICDMKRTFVGKVNILERFFRYDIKLDFQDVITIYDHPEVICYMMNAPFAKLMRKSFIDQNKIRFIKGYIYEDLVFVQEILSCNPRISIVKEKLYNYIVRNNSTMTSKKSKVTDMFVSYKNVYNAYDHKGIAKYFKIELDYLCLYHVMIGTTYRMWRSRQYGLRNSITQCRSYVNDYKCTGNNKYIKKKGLISRLYIKIII